MCKKNISLELQIQIISTESFLLNLENGMTQNKNVAPQGLNPDWNADVWPIKLMQTRSKDIQSMPNTFTLH